MINNKVYGLLGICAKAGKVAAGTDLVIEEIKKNNIHLIIIAEDTSEKSIKNITYYAEKYNVEIIIYGNKFDNSKAIGKQNKAIIAIRDRNFANSIKNLINGGV